MQFGDLAFKTEAVGDFYGILDGKLQQETFFDYLFNKARLMNEDTEEEECASADNKKHFSAVKTSDVRLNHLYAVISEKRSHLAHIDLTTELANRMRIDHIFSYFAPEENRKSEPVLPRNFECLKTLK